VVSLGNFATKLLLDTKEGITKIRGKEFPSRDGAVSSPPSTRLLCCLAAAQCLPRRGDFVAVKRAGREPRARDADAAPRSTATHRGLARRRSAQGDAVLVGDLGAGAVFAGIAGALGVVDGRQPAFTLVREYRVELAPCTSTWPPATPGWKAPVSTSRGRP
jgi:hypothetical protein